MKYLNIILLVVLIFLGCISTHSAQAQVDFDSLYAVSKKLIRINPDSAYVLSYQLENLAKLKNQSSHYSKIHLLRGDIHLIKKEEEQALEEYEKMDDLVQNDTILQVKLGRLSRYYRNRGEYDEAMKYALKCLTHSENIKDTIKITSSLGNISSIYNRLNNNTEANNYESKRISLAKKSGYTKGEFLGYYNSSQYLEKDQTQQKIQYLEKADSINNFYLKNAYYKQAIKLNKGETLHELGRPQEALLAMEEIKTKAVKNKNKKVRLFFIQVYSQILNSLKRYDEAETYILRGLEIASQSNSLESQNSLYDDLLENYELTDNYKGAYTTLLKQKDIQDSLTNSEVLKEIESLKLDYETSKKDAELAKTKLTINNRTNQRNIAIISSLFLLAIALHFWRRFYYKKRESIQRQKIQKQKIAVLEKEKKILSLAAMIEGQEEERKRIAQDLHDGLGGLLSSVKSHFSIIQSEIQKLENLNIYNKANDIIDEAVGEVRRISQNLMPSSLRMYGLETAARQFIEEMDNTNTIKYNFECIGPIDEMTTENQAVSIYRIIQEGCNNINKHSQASRATIQMQGYENKINIIIEDNGVGFDTKLEYSGIGMKSLLSRVDHLNGSLEIDSRINKGTTLYINVPINNDH